MLKNKSLVIMGGTSGMGWSAARACAAAGAELVLVGLDGSTEEVLSRLDEPSRKRCRLLIADARDSATAERAVALCQAEFGKLDGLYHVAGGSGRRLGDGPAHAVDDQAWRHTVAWNLDTAFFSARAALRAWQAAATEDSTPAAASLVLMSSVLAGHPATDHFATHAYAAAKSGVIGLARSLAAHYSPINVRVNVLAPGLVETPMSQRACGDAEIVQYVRRRQALDGGRIGRPEDIDGVVVYMMSDASRFVTGQVIHVDGGWSVRG